MDTRDLEYVVCIQQQGTIGKAADALGISQPALTKAVRRVEQQLGIQLFERLPQGMRATQAGELFLERAKHLSRDFDDALAEMRCISTGEQGVVRLGYSPTFPDTLVVAACRRLMRERPAARLRLRCRMARELLEALDAGELDMAFVPIPDSNREFAMQPLYEDRLVVAADPGHPLVARRQVTLADLQGEEWLLPAGHMTVRQMLEAAFRQRGLPPPALRAEADFSSEILYQLVEGTRLLTLARHGKGFLGTGLAAIDLAPKELELDRCVGIVTRAQGYLSPVCQRTIELFREEMAKKDVLQWL
ncbi:LysR family transcriptional regulator [Pseudomonas schmalbachii]|uniref:LysR family transcriptional regulator n=1 Tax=Pseudomonas schmalbachii TaxID=2816993 RepID=A0ABS3TJU7_9PSED|nr:LysR family transcriptional regulator [Pseudomonas schmalbachii]MBO3273935.1 LysR family transcriptional regulator [Pseudomonas schmalbachii]